MNAAAINRLDPPVPVGTVELRAGPWTMLFEAGDLRYIRYGPAEAVRRIYGAVRDENWDTVPRSIEDLVMRADADDFSVRYTSVHRRGGIHFVWRAEITGDAAGVVRFAFNGEAKSDFRRNRIGLCVLVPSEAAGARCRVTRRDGSRSELTLPDLVEPAQPVPLIHDLGTFAYEVQPGFWAEITFEGDSFEMEDQRNWIDASFKIYGTPLHLPRPVWIPAGTCIRQVVTLRAQGATPVVKPAPRDTEPVRVSIGTETRVLPTIGLGVAAHGEPLSPHEIACLRELWLCHLRVDVRLARESWLGDLHLAATQSKLLNTPLELAVHVPREEPARRLTLLAEQLAGEELALARILVLEEGRPSTSSRALEMARAALGEFGVPLGVGTDADFYQLNQHRPPWDGADFVHWSMNPQVHAFDTTSLRETPTAIPAQLRSARAYFPGRSLVISPVTLRPRFNAVATAGQPETNESGLPYAVDVRQLSPFAAVWTLAVIKHLAENGAESVTLFETTGWRGVLEREAGSANPELFPSRAGTVFPLYHAIGLVTRFRGDMVMTSRSSDPLRVESLVLVRKRRMAVILANMTEVRQTVRLDGPGQFTRRRDLDWSDDSWAAAPQSVLEDPGTPIRPPASRELELELAPHALVRLEVAL
jgi:hypothetical protein